MTNLRRMMMAAAGAAGGGAATEGYLATWGDGATGQLGTGSTVDTSSPVNVGSDENWTFAVASNPQQSFGLKADYTMWGMGRNTAGYPLGNSGAYGNVSSPVQISSGENWLSLAGGVNSHAAVTTDYKLFTWGRGDFGRLGNGTTSGSVQVPTQIGALTDWLWVTGGYSTFAAVKTDGKLWTWGSGTSGELGDGADSNRCSPVNVGSLTNWHRVNIGTGNTMTALKTDGTIWSWGAGGGGALGHSNTTSYCSPVQIGAATDWAYIATGKERGAAINTAGKLYTWGDNTNGELGLGTTTGMSSPSQVGTDVDWAKIFMGKLMTFATKTDGTLWSWGNPNAYGLLGDLTGVARSSPVQVGALSWVMADVYHKSAVGIHE